MVTEAEPAEMQGSSSSLSSGEWGGGLRIILTQKLKASVG
jgi:hypothetical protein